jgi:Integrase core domain
MVRWVCSVALRQDGRPVGEHHRCFGRDQTVFDPWHYVPVLARKPGALGNGAPFKDWPQPAGLERIRRRLTGASDGDRQMVNILTAVLSDGLPAVEAACLEALREGVHSAPWFPLPGCDHGLGGAAQGSACAARGMAAEGTRKVLAWRVSNTMEVEFCIEALEEALKRFGRPDIFNTDQGSQFTSPRFTGVLQDAGVRISMDGRGRWMDNVFIERLWRSLKYECVYLTLSKPDRSCVPGCPSGSATTTPGGLIRPWPGTRPTRHTEEAKKWRDWRADDTSEPSLSRPPNCPDGRDQLR